MSKVKTFSLFWCPFILLSLQLRQHWGRCCLIHLCSYGHCKGFVHCFCPVFHPSLFVSWEQAVLISSALGNLPNKNPKRLRAFDDLSQCWSGFEPDSQCNMVSTIKMTFTCFWEGVGIKRPLEATSGLNLELLNVNDGSSVVFLIPGSGFNSVKQRKWTFLTLFPLFLLQPGRGSQQRSCGD